MNELVRSPLISTNLMRLSAKCTKFVFIEETSFNETPRRGPRILRRSYSTNTSCGRIQGPAVVPAGKEMGSAIATQIEHDGDKPMRGREASSTYGAVPVTSKFHLAHPHLWLALLKRALRPLCVRKPRRRRRPEDDRPVRFRSVPTGSLRRQGIRYGLHHRPCLFRAEAAVDAYNNKGELHGGEERGKKNNK